MSSRKIKFSSVMVQVGGMVCLTLILVEIAARLVWWGQPVVTVFGRDLYLLPLPLATHKHLEILATWQENPHRYQEFDPVLGWTIRPNARAEQGDAVFTSNSIGIRSLREYPRDKPPGLIRIATFGPSFTHGDEVSDQATWQVYMERARPDIEVMNWGVGGYGTDQALLRYTTQALPYRPDIVIIGIEENNIWRNVNRFRPFQHYTTEVPLTKPIFILEQDRLVLLENPFQDFKTLQDYLINDPSGFLDRVCPHDYFCDRAKYQPLPLDIFTSFRFLRTLVYEVGQSDAPENFVLEQSADQTDWLLNEVQRTNWLLIQMFVTEVSRNGSQPVILLFPERSSIEATEHGQRVFYHAGATFLEEQGLHVIELTSAFVEHKQQHQLSYDDYYVSDGGHFSELGNSVVGQTVLTSLCREQLLPDCP